jgi:arsenate reductase (thioredoxin)
VDPLQKRVLFVCSQNSGRSQIAEELLRRLAGERFAVESAGLKPGVLNPVVVQALKEIGIDISRKKTQDVFHLAQQKKTYDFVITVCDESQAESCPSFPGKHARIHWNFPDPASFSGTPEDKLQKTRDLRDRIKSTIQDWLRVSEFSD